MNKLTITVPSKGRAGTSSTLHLLQHQSVKIPVYIYVDQEELKAYSDFYEEFIVVPHNETTIGDIRLFIQRHQYELGNNTVMMDDDMINFFDVTGTFSASISQLIDEIQKAFAEGCDFASPHVIAEQVPWRNFKGMEETDENAALWGTWWDMWAVIFGMKTTLYEKGIRFTGGRYVSEDFEWALSINLNKDKVKTKRIQMIARHSYNEKDTHFGDTWYSNSAILLYEKYGRIVSLRRHDHWAGALSLHFNTRRIKEFKARGNKPLYEKHSLNMLAGWFNGGFPGYSLAYRVLKKGGYKFDEFEGKFAFDYDYNGFDASESIEFTDLLKGMNSTIEPIEISDDDVSPVRETEE